MRLVLEIRKGSRAGQRIVVEPDQTARVGRRSDAEFAFPGDAGISGLHFAIDCTGGAWHIQDLKSTNGTWLNGKRVSDAVLHEGDEIKAGEARFAVHIDRDEQRLGAGQRVPDRPPAGPVAAAALPPATQVGVAAPVTAPSTPAERDSGKPPAELSPQDRLLGMLRKDFQPLYAILDAARSPDIYKFLVEARDDVRKSQREAQRAEPAFQPPGKGTLDAGAEYESLYEGRPKAELVHFAPYLVRLLPESKLLEALVSRGWGKSWGVYLTSSAPFREVRRHLRQFLMVKLPDGKQVYFRFYDPRVLRVYLPTCTREEGNEFFGPVKYHLTEDEKPETLLRFSNTAAGVGRRKFSLAPQAASP